MRFLHRPAVLLEDCSLNHTSCSSRSVPQSLDVSVHTRYRSSPSVYQVATCGVERRHSQKNPCWGLELLYLSLLYAFSSPSNTAIRTSLGISRLGVLRCTSKKEKESMRVIVAGFPGSLNWMQLRETQGRLLSFIFTSHLHAVRRWTTNAQKTPFWGHLLGK